MGSEMCIRDSGSGNSTCLQSSEIIRTDSSNSPSARDTDTGSVTSLPNGEETGSHSVVSGGPESSDSPSASNVESHISPRTTVTSSDEEPALYNHFDGMSSIKTCVRSKDSCMLSSVLRYAVRCRRALHPLLVVAQVLHATVPLQTFCWVGPSLDSIGGLVNCHLVPAEVLTQGQLPLVVSCVSSETLLLPHHHAVGCIPQDR